jgi:hypothetical protein
LARRVVAIRSACTLLLKKGISLLNSISPY